MAWDGSDLASSSPSSSARTPRRLPKASASSRPSFRLGLRTIPDPHEDE